MVHLTLDLMHTLFVVYALSSVCRSTPYYDPACDIRYNIFVIDWEGILVNGNKCLNGHIP